VPKGLPVLQVQVLDLALSPPIFLLPFPRQALSSCPFTLRQGLAMLPRLIWNSWAQVIFLSLPGAGTTGVHFCAQLGTF
jgi:hypothetical protein